MHIENKTVIRKLDVSAFVCAYFVYKCNVMFNSLHEWINRPTDRLTTIDNNRLFIPDCTTLF